MKEETSSVALRQLLHRRSVKFGTDLKMLPFPSGEGGPSGRMRSLRSPQVANGALT
jgi:hypothetical protein